MDPLSGYVFLSCFSFAMQVLARNKHLKCAIVNRLWIAHIFNILS
jgi:hypothetical protein